MKKCVYSVLNEGAVINRILQEQGMEVVVGNIVRRVAAIAHAFEMEIAGYDPFAKQESIPVCVERPPFDLNQPKRREKE